MGVELMVASAVLGVGSGIAKYNESKDQAATVMSQTESQVAERKKTTESQLGNQTMSFLKSGVTLEGTPSAILKETERFGREDVSAMRRYGGSKAKSIKSQGRAAMFSSVAQGAMNVGGVI